MRFLYHNLPTTRTRTGSMKHLEITLVSWSVRYKCGATFSMLQMHENEISLRKWSGGTAHLWWNTAGQVTRGECDIRWIIDVGAGKFLGVGRIFARPFPENVRATFCANIFSWPLLGWPPWRRYSCDSAQVGCHFHRIETFGGALATPPPIWGCARHPAPHTTEMNAFTFNSINAYHSKRQKWPENQFRNMTAHISRTFWKWNDVHFSVKGFN